MLHAGYAMHSAQHPMESTEIRESDAAPLPGGTWCRPEPVLDCKLIRKGIWTVFDDRGRHLLPSLSRVRVVFGFWPSSVDNPLHNIGRTGSFGRFLPFLLFALVLASAAPGSRSATPAVPLCRFLCYGAPADEGHGALRLPVDGSLIPLAALAVTDLPQRARAAIPKRAH